MKILFVHPFFPYPLVSGGHQALFNGVLAVKDDYDIYIAYEAWEGEAYFKAEKEFMERIPNAHLFPLIHRKVKLSIKQKVVLKIKRKLQWLCPRKSISLTNNVLESTCDNWINSVLPQKKEWTDHIHNLHKKYHFDLIQVEMPRFVSHILSLPKDVKTIYVHHELGFVRRELERKEFPDSIYVNACEMFADVNEISLLNMYDTVVTLSPIDARKLEVAGVNARIIPSYANVDNEDVLEFCPVERKRLTFVGPERHPLNVIGIQWFLDNCWHLLKKMDPDYSLEIIGIWSSERMKDFSRKYEDVHFLGFVENLKESINNSIMIIPITIGSGIRMKILEAASSGIPFVSTKVGAEGIPVVNGTHCFITDDASTFVEDIVKLQNIELQKKFVMNSYKMIKDNYSMAALRSNRIKIYNQTLTDANN